MISNEYPIKKTVLNFFNNFTDSRYLSWEHCYIYFQNNIKNTALNEKRIDEEILNNACLHLAFYLASWGMLRGSSFLLQHDYKVHIPLIKNIIINPIYKKLWEFNFNSDNKEIEIFLNLLFDKEIGLINSIKASYSNGYPTDTLATKIIMGIFGCIPAYDRFFIKGLWYANSLNNSKTLFIQNLSKNSMKKIIDFYLTNFNEWNNIDIFSQDTTHRYPQMKLIDMYFWNIGVEKS